MVILDALILGIVEGLTEFIPVSSTGHMILASKLMNLKQDEFLKTFEVAVQLGSILAVLFIFFDKLKQNISLWINLIISFIPTACIGFLLYSHIKSLFNDKTTAYMLIIYGVIFIVVEIFLIKKPNKTEINDINNITKKQSLIIGLSQCLAMVPGTSRSGVTIIASLLCGLSRQSAAMFSFLLAIPTMLAATLYDTYKNYEIIISSLENIQILLVGLITAFFTSIITIKVFMKFIAKSNYIPFGIYRIIVGMVFLIFIC